MRSVSSLLTPVVVVVVEELVELGVGPPVEVVVELMTGEVIVEGPELLEG